jgi:hypothetical protein
MSKINTWVWNPKPHLWTIFSCHPMQALTQMVLMPTVTFMGTHRPTSWRVNYALLFLLLVLLVLFACWQ